MPDRLLRRAALVAATIAIGLGVSPRARAQDLAAPLPPPPAPAPHAPKLTRPPALKTEPAPVYPPAAPPPRLILRGRIREKGTREPIVGASVQVIRHAATAGAPDATAEEVGTSDARGAFEVRADAPAGARIVVTESAHESCVRDLTA